MTANPGPGGNPRSAEVSRGRRGRGLHEFCTPGCGSRQPPVAVISVIPGVSRLFGGSLEFLKVFQVLEVLRAASCLLHPDEVIEGREGRLHGTQVGHDPSLPDFLEASHPLDERMDVQRKIVLTEENLVPSEILYTGVRHIVAESYECFAQAPEVLLVTRDEEVEIGRRAHPPVGGERRGPDDDVTDARLV